MAGIFAANIAQGLGLVQMHQLREEVLLYLERERIARDLHDIVIQRIFAAGLGISALRKHLPTEATGRRGLRGLTALRTDRVTPKGEAVDPERELQPI